MRLFLIYAIIELAVVVVLATTIGFGWTVLVLLATSILGFVLAGSQVRRQIRRLRSGLSTPQGAVTDSALVALGTVLVFVPGLVTTGAGLLLLLPPTRTVARPLLTAVAAKRAPLITVAASSMGTMGRRTTVRGDYIDGEVIDVVDSQVDPDRPPPVPPALPRTPE